ncbi:calcium ATPase [Gonapodya prolifera JEL478]|uniref:Calcium-transporting ATPase n=1 Tax=Gonapodya prolifera (strain JEL478) TaxID=1344416 RepID=A0A138ZWV7_GONPJ|nr:calcium ATPase [Gonapodya prolifera JEL478]|eukprot:KXS08992.1 calcium ATPase [Gonapodya prolifera JEL478]
MSEAAGAPIIEAPWSQSVKEVLGFYNVDPEKGLDAKRAKEELVRHGKNELPEEPPTPLWELILEQFKDQLVLILLGAAVISFVLAALEADPEEQKTAFVEPFVILLILVANATVGVINESRAEEAIKALKEYSPDKATVLRSSRLTTVDAAEVVPGDIVLLTPGASIPADCRLVKITSSSLRVDQSILTGESVSVIKDAAALVKDLRAVKQDQLNMVFSGTTVTIGKAVAVVTATGSNTAIGDIHQSISSQISEPTPLKRKLDEFGDQLARIITVICILVWVVNVRHFDTHGGTWMSGAIYYFKIAVALAVAAIPEGLSVVITTCLALGTQKMAAQGAVVRKLKSVETLGCTSVICTDKTGTVTTNQMNVRKILAVDPTSHGFLDEYEVSGTSYSPDGIITDAHGHQIDQATFLRDHVVLDEMSHVLSVCNDSSIAYETAHHSFHAIGEPTEAALKVLVEKLRTNDPAFNRMVPNAEGLDAEGKTERAQMVNKRVEGQYKKVITLEFTRDRKSMSVLVERKPGVRVFYPAGSNRTLFLKGAPESVLERCAVREWAAEALRVLAVAVVDEPTLNERSTLDPVQFSKYESGATFLGLVAMLDPPRPEVGESIKKCKEAGIRVIVITGDNKNTAEAICQQIGIFPPTANLQGLSFTGREFDDMTQSQKVAAVRSANLFSRTEPTHKQQLVDLLKSEGYVVAMTGDGVNDAPALKKADIGIAMGTGTDVAKYAADMVLANDNFSTIVSAVEEGRSIYNNTKQFIRYLISSNIGEVVSIFLTVLLGMPEALIPVQLLWVNLVTDGLPATALGFNPPDHDIMRLPPRDANEAIVTSWLFIRYCVIGTYVGAATVFGYAWWFMFYEGGPQVTFYQLSNFSQCESLFPEIGCQIFNNGFASRASTMSLSILVTIEMFNAMNSLSEDESLLTLPLWNNLYLCFAIALSMALHFMILYVPFFNSIFAIAPLNYTEWQAVVLISLPVLFIDEILKFISRNVVHRRSTKGGAFIEKRD